MNARFLNPENPAKKKFENFKNEIHLCSGINYTLPKSVYKHRKNVYVVKNIF